MLDYIPNLITTLPGDLDHVRQKYEEERNKRLRSDGLAQYLDLEASDQHDGFSRDLWADERTVNLGARLPQNSHVRFTIIGAGFTGIGYAIGLIKAGIDRRRIRMIDTADGFGGTWYWNRYPGLMCDIESSVFFPWLEEMNYIPKHRYGSGEELKAYIELIAQRYRLHEIASWRARVHRLQWDEGASTWRITLQQRMLEGREQEITVTSDFVITATGFLNYPKLPRIPSLTAFEGSMFHTARWDYSKTGGSPTDPSLTGLRDKTVAIVGTGATGVQVVPQLAKWAQKLYVVQRTPAAVHYRDNRSIDPEQFKRGIANHPGWQAERMQNFHRFLNKWEPAPDVNLVDDALTHIPSMAAFWGTPSSKFTGTPESLRDHLAEMNSLDTPVSEKVRARVDEIVHDKEAAESLKAWFPQWSKRPCFHDDYLPSFNKFNVTLLDTDGAGVTAVTPTGLAIAGKEYPVDIIIWSTGYNATGFTNPGQQATIEITGMDGRTMNETRNFPNLFFPGPLQAGTGGSLTASNEKLIYHGVHIIMKALGKANSIDQKVVVQPSAEGAEEWGNTIASSAGIFAALIGCTPSFATREGEIEKDIPPEERVKKAKGGIYGHGLEKFWDLIQAWRDEGSLKGLEITVV